jgi:hypothetical protein
MAATGRAIGPARWMTCLLALRADLRRAVRNMVEVVDVQERCLEGVMMSILTMLLSFIGSVASAR